MEPHDLPEVAYLLTILISLSITCAIGVYAFRQRKVVGAMAFAVTIFLEAAWIMGYLAGTINITLQGKIFWDNIQWIPILFLPLAILSFAREYGGTRFKHPVRVWTILSIIPIGTLVAVFTNPWHGLAESSMRLSFGGIFPEFVYDFGPLLWAGVVYALAVTYVGVMTLIRLALRQQGIFRSQILFIVLGFVIPTFGTLIGMMALVIGYDHNLDLSPFTFTIANILVAYGLFRYRLFEVVPFAREQVMEKMVDGVIILDAFGRMLDVNGAFQKMVGLPDGRWGGQPLISMLPDWFDQADLNPAVPSGHKEIALRQNQLTRYIDVEITWLLNPRGQFSGHMIILRDITAHKTQENALKEGQSILEQLVSERTAELHAANEFFKAEAEQRRRAELEKEAQRSEMEILYKLTVELAELPVDADLEHIIVARLKQLTGANIVALTEYNPDKKQLEMRGLETDSVILREANRIFGRNFLELVVPVDEAG
jgi:PAS domain S-box-containing protein